MPSSESKKVRRVYNKLQKHRAAAVFLQEVNEEMDGAPGYYDIIKQPMDLGKIKNKVDQKVYTSFSQFEADVRLMLSNCYVFNLPGSFAYDQGQMLENVLEKELAKGREGDESQNMTIVESREQSPVGNAAMVIPTKPVDNLLFDSSTITQLLPTTQPSQPQPQPSRSSLPPQLMQSSQQQQQQQPHLQSQASEPQTLSQATQHPSTSSQQQPKQFVQSPSRHTPSPQHAHTHKSQPSTLVPSPKHQRQHGSEPPPFTARPQQPLPGNPETVANARSLPTSMPPSSTPTSVPRTRTIKDICTSILIKTMESRHAFEFIRPVDPIKQGIPQYMEIIKRPMDLGTIKANLVNDQYASVQQFDDDIRLMLSNCYKFNPPNTYVYNEAKQLEQIYNKEYDANFGTNRQTQSPNAPRYTTTTPNGPPQGDSSATKVPTISASIAQHKDQSALNLHKASQPPSAPVTPIKKEKPRKSSLKTVPTLPVSSSAGPSTTMTTSPRTSAIQPLMDATNTDKCRRILSQLWNRPESLAFHYPVSFMTKRERKTTSD